LEEQSLDAQVPLALLLVGSHSANHDKVLSSTGADAKRVGPNISHKLWLVLESLQLVAVVLEQMLGEPQRIQTESTLDKHHALLWNLFP
jgi:hypothetical protein